MVLGKNLKINNNKLLIVIIMVISILLILITIICFSVKLYRVNKELEYIKEHPIVLYDTIYDKTELNNIQDKIDKKEEQVEKYKNDIIYETNKVIELSDSATVKLFYQLLSEL